MKQLYNVSNIEVCLHLEFPLGVCTQNMHTYSSTFSVCRWSFSLSAALMFSLK